MTLLIALSAFLILPAAPADSPAATGTAVKTLDEITIEGEVRLPRVLFITSRETERPLDFLDEYLPPVGEMASEIAPAGPVPVTTPAPAAGAEVDAETPDEPESTPEEGNR